MNNVSVDPTSNWILSASADSMIQVWSFLDLMSSDESQSAFGSYGGLSPLRSFSSHRAPINALATGHSSYESNIVISASSDKVLHLWSMTNGDVLQTYLLNLPPLCMALDPADRAIYVGHEDGSIQMVDFQASAGGSRSEIAIPASPELLWSLNEGGREADSINSLTLSYDGMTVLSAHSSGKVHAWDVCTGKWKLCIHCHDRPVSNIRMLRPKGLSQRHKDGMTRSKEVIKPRFDSIGGRAGKFPVTAHFADKMKPLSPAIQYNEASFSNILCSSVAPDFLVDEGLTAFAQPLPNTTQRDYTRVSTMDGADDLPSPVADLEKQNSNLMSQLKEALVGQKKAIKQCMAYERDQHFRRLEDEKKRARKKRRRLRQMRVKEIQRKEFMGQAISGQDLDVMMHEAPDDEEDLSSDTSEITD